MGWCSSVHIEAGRVMNFVCGYRLQGFPPWGLIRGSSSGSYCDETDEACRCLKLKNALK